MKLKKKIVSIAAFILIILMVFGGCSSDKTADQNQATDKPGGTVTSSPTNPPQGFTVNKIDFKEINLNDLDQEQVGLINDFAITGGYYYWVDTNGVYTMFIGLGEKLTGGYSLKVLSVEDNEGKTNILVEETIPKADEMVTQALTYPYILIEMKGITDRFTVTNTHNEEYKLINVDELDAHTVEGVYQGQIDNNSIEVKVGESYMVFRNPEMSSMVAGFKKDDLIKVIYKTTNDGQFILENIKSVKVDNDETLTIEGVYQGQIDNNSIEVKVGESYMVFRNSDMSNIIAGLKKDDLVNVTYSTSQEGQFLLVGIEPRT